MTYSFHNGKLVSPTPRHPFRQLVIWSSYLQNGGSSFVFSLFIICLLLSALGGEEVFWGVGGECGSVLG